MLTFPSLVKISLHVPTSERDFDISLPFSTRDISHSYYPQLRNVRLRLIVSFTIIIQFKLMIMTYFIFGLKKQEIASEKEIAGPLDSFPLHSKSGSACNWFTPKGLLTADPPPPPPPP